MLSILLLATTLLSVSKSGVDLTVETETPQIDPARSTFVTLTLKAGRGVAATPPQLRERVRGFSQAEEFAEDPVVAKDGSSVQTVTWQLTPEPCADVYRIAPFVVPVEVTGKKYDFWAGPVCFEAPAAREAVTGGIEVDPKKVLPPLSWKLVGRGALGVLAVLAILAALVFLVRYLARRVKEHRMSPIERAWAELDRLLKRGLPDRGRYKDFYIELTMVVRRYVQRQHGVRAPNLTTEEFFEATRHAPSFPKSTLDELIDFLRKADMVKFAGVQATPETAQDATTSARVYIAKDNEVVVRKREFQKDAGGVK